MAILSTFFPTIPLTFFFLPQMYLEIIEPFPFQIWKLYVFLFKKLRLFKFGQHFFEQDFVRHSLSSEIWGKLIHCIRWHLGCRMSCHACFICACLLSSFVSILYYVCLFFLYDCMLFFSLRMYRPIHLSLCMVVFMCEVCVPFESGGVFVLALCSAVWS